MYIYICLKNEEFLPELREKERIEKVVYCNYVYIISLY